jgi:hypothetical protein
MLDLRYVLALVIENDPGDQLFELPAQSRLESAYFVVARRGKNASRSVLRSLRSLRLALRASLAQHGGARFPVARSSQRPVACCLIRFVNSVT